MDDYEIWSSSEDEWMLCGAGPAGQSARATLPPGSGLVETFSAATGDAATEQYHAVIASRR